MPYIGRSTEAFGVRSRFTYTPSADDTSVSGNDVNGLPVYLLLMVLTLMYF